MKKSIKIFAVLFTIIHLAACGGKAIDEPTKEAVLIFDADWNATMIEVDKWVVSTQAEVVGMPLSMTGITERLNSMSAEIKEAVQVDLAMCDQIAAEMKTLSDAAGATLNDWKADKVSWAEFIKEVEGGNAKQADAESKLEEMNVKLTAAKTALTDWTTQWTALKETFTASISKIRMSMMGNDVRR